MSRSEILRPEQVPVRTYDSITDIGRPAWDDLVRVSRAPVFFSYDFLHSIELSPLSRPSQPVYLTASTANGDLAAALVLYRQETVDPFAATPGGPTLRMLTGGVWHCYDTVLLAARPVDADLVASFVARMRHLGEELDVDVYGLVNVAWESDLATLLGASGLTGGETTPRYRLRMRPQEIPTVQAHLATVGRSSRRVLGQYARRAERAGTQITFEFGRDALDADVLDLCKRTADKHAPNYYPPTELSDLIVRLGAACRIIRVELDGVLLATSICLLDAGRAHFWAGGCLYPAELNWSPQYVLFRAELEAGFRLGRPVIEFGRRNDEFKTRYGLERHRLGRFVSG